MIQVHLAAQAFPTDKIKAEDKKLEWGTVLVSLATAIAIVAS